MVLINSSFSFPLNITVILTATDGAVSVPGGYVVPLNGSLTLICNATGAMFSSLVSLQWNITLVGSTSVIGTRGTLDSSGRGKYSVPDGLQTENPTLLRVHNLQLNESSSTFQCSVPDNLGGYLARSQAQVVFVEGEMAIRLHIVNIYRYLKVLRN